VTRSTAYGPALTLAATLVTLGVLELGARAIAPPAVPHTAMFRPAAGVAYELIPGWRGRGPLGEDIRVNAAGFRGPEIDAPQAGTTRVLTLGDSFTFGIGVAEEQTFPAALARALARSLGGAIEVLNGGVPGYNLFQETRALAARADALAPDVVVLGFVENDLYNLDGSDFVAAFDGSLLPRPGAFHAAVTLNPFAALSGPWLWLQLHSAAFRVGSLWAIHTSLSVRGDAELTALASRAEHGTDLPTRLLRGDDDEATTRRWEAAVRELRSAAVTAQRIGAPLVLVLFPRPEQLYAPGLRGGFARVAIEAERAGIVVVDPTDLLAEDHDRVDLYLFPADHHPSARGHARIAEITARSLSASTTLPCHRKAATGLSDVGEPLTREEP
jgi:lysophospholipase L1-like esterase